MWWQLFIVLVATAAVSAEDNEEDHNSCMSVLHHECEEDEEQPDDFPGNAEELEEFCKYSLKYFDCSDRVFSSCEGSDTDIGQYLGELGALIRRVCTEDQLLRTAVAALLPCFKENLSEIKSCEAGFIEDQDTFTDVVNEIIHVGDSEDSPSHRCLSLLYGVGCTAATTGQVCGDVAKDIVLNLLQALDSPFHVCPAGVKDKLPEIVQVMQLELEQAKFENSLRKKK